MQVLSVSVQTFDDNSIKTIKTAVRLIVSEPVSSAIITSKKTIEVKTETNASASYRFAMMNTETCEELSLIWSLSYYPASNKKNQCTISKQDQLTTISFTFVPKEVGCAKDKKCALAVLVNFKL